MFSSGDVLFFFGTVDRFGFRVAKRTLFSIDKDVIRSSRPFFGLLNVPCSNIGSNKTAVG